MAATRALIVLDAELVIAAIAGVSTFFGAKAVEADQVAETLAVVIALNRGRGWLAARSQRPDFGSSARTLLAASLTRSASSGQPFDSRNEAKARPSSA